MSKLAGSRTGRLILGAAVFLGAASMLFEAAGQPLPLPLPRPNARTATGVVQPYEAIPDTDASVRKALQFALSDQKSKNKSAIKLLGVLKSERQISNGENYRLCLSVDRRGRVDTARVVVQHSPKDRWSVALWAWGACAK
jgi:hypothetical protein